jgi:hypothetical protein
VPVLAFFWDRRMEKFLVDIIITSDAGLAVDAITAGIYLNFALA